MAQVRVSAEIPRRCLGMTASSINRTIFASYRFRSPRSPWPAFDVVFAFLRRSAASDRPTSSLSLNCPPEPRRTNRLSVPVLISSRLLELRFDADFFADFLLEPRFAADFFVDFFAIENLRSGNRCAATTTTEAKNTEHMDDSRTGKMAMNERGHRGGAILVRALRDIWRTLRDDCRAITRRAWWRWGMTLLVGFVICAAISYAGTKFAHARVDRGLQAWDERMIMKLVDEGPISFPNAILLESPGNLAYLIPLTITASVIAIRRHAPLAAITIHVAYWLQRPIVIIGWETWNRSRPKLIGDGIAAPGLHSFPSGHAALCVAVYGFLAYLWIRSSQSFVEKVIAVALVAVLTALVSLARVRLGSHWPSDILAGAALGIMWVGVVIVAYRNAMRSARRDLTNS